MTIKHKSEMEINSNHQYLGGGGKIVPVLN
jgi:hypothetical protein